MWNLMKLRFGLNCASNSAIDLVRVRTFNPRRYLLLRDTYTADRLIGKILLAAQEGEGTREVLEGLAGDQVIEHGRRP